MFKVFNNNLRIDTQEGTIIIFDNTSQEPINKINK